MNFGKIIKNEIISKEYKDKSIITAFLAGIMRGSGKLFENEYGLGLDFTVSDERTAMYVSNQLNDLFNYDLRDVAVSEDRLNNKDKFILSLTGERAVEILGELDILKTVDNEIQVNYDFYSNKFEEENLFKSFMRGLFLTNGVCTIPDREDSKTGYHLELNFSHGKTAQLTAVKLEKYGITPRITRRKEDYVLYIKSAEEIKDFLAFLSVPVSVVKLTEVMIEKEFVNNVNRRKNCDLGNVNRQIEASTKILEAIEKIESTVGLNSLKDELKETAIAKRKNPEESYTELSNRLNISKSCLNHRLRKIVCIANGKEE